MQGPRCDTAQWELCSLLSGHLCSASFQTTKVGLGVLRVLCLGEEEPFSSTTSGVGRAQGQEMPSIQSQTHHPNILLWEMRMRENMPQTPEAPWAA